MKPGSLVRVKWLSMVMNHESRDRKADEVGLLVSWASRLDPHRYQTSLVGKYAAVMFSDGSLDIINSLGLEQLQAA